MKEIEQRIQALKLKRLELFEKYVDRYSKKFLQEEHKILKEIEKLSKEIYHEKENKICRQHT